MRLVVQGSNITFQHLTHIHQLCNSTQQFMQIAEHAYYLPNQTAQNAAIKDFCAAQQIDCAYVEPHHTLKNFGLAVMDMDSTLISIECIDEIADMQGIKPQVSAITESAMRGEIEFAESLRRRVALLAGLPAKALQQVIEERLKLNPGAQEWIAACKVQQIKTMVVSGGFDFFANHVKNLLGLDYAHANQLEITDGKLTGRILGKIVDAEAKADYLIAMRKTLGLSSTQTIAIGDGANDLKMMAIAEAGVAYHAKPIVQQQARYSINHCGLDGVMQLFSL